MFTHALYALLALTASAGTTLASPTGVSTIDGKSPLSNVAAAPGNVHPTREFVPRMTNARRLALGLPPIASKRTTAPRAMTSAGSTILTKTGTIAVTDVNTNMLLGYISQADTSFNHFGVAPLPADALTFEFDVVSTATSTSQLDISATTSTYFATYPLLGGIVGVASTDDDLALASSNYAFVQGTTHTAPGSPPTAAPNSYPTTENTESAIWTYDAVSQAIAAQWINTDSSEPATSVVYVTDSNALVLTGDVAAFQADFGISSVQVALTFTTEQV